MFKLLVVQARMTTLASLLLANCRINGTLQPLAALTSMAVLNLCGNRLEGDFSALVGMSALTILNVSRNTFSLPAVTSIASLVPLYKLKVLDLSHLPGLVSTDLRIELNMYPQMAQLDVSYTGLSGTATANPTLPNRLAIFKSRGVFWECPNPYFVASILVDTEACGQPGVLTIYLSVMICGAIATLLIMQCSGVYKHPKIAITINLGRWVLSVASFINNMVFLFEVCFVIIHSLLRFFWCVFYLLLIYLSPFVSQMVSLTLGRTVNCEGLNVRRMFYPFCYDVVVNDFSNAPVRLIW